MNTINGVVEEGRLMDTKRKENPYELAGWLGIAGAMLVLPLMVLGILLDILHSKHGSLPGGLPLVYFVVGVTQALFALYALYRFRDYINERFDFHDVDSLVTFMLLGIMAITAVAFTAKLAAWSGAGLPAVIAFLALIILIGIPLSVVSIVFAVKLLQLPSTLGGLLKPMVVCSITSSVCFLLIVTAPLGMLIGAAGDVILGIILLRQSGMDEELEFV